MPIISVRDNDNNTLKRNKKKQTKTENNKEGEVGGGEKQQLKGES